MSRFLQLHILTSYPPANLNRDDLGRPKTAQMGGVTRLRVSSQSLKRAWRCSDVFERALKRQIGTRTKEMGLRIRDRLRAAGVSEKKAGEWAQQIAGQFGKLKSLTDKERKQLKDEALEPGERRALAERPFQTEQLAHFSPSEIAAIDELTDRLAAEDRGPADDELRLLRKDHQAADIALFGRMLAAVPEFNAEAACQVAHAISVHAVQVEDDFFTAVDDLNDGQEDLGAGHMGETEFAAAVFYLYICLDRESLAAQLGQESEMSRSTIRALVEAALKVAPTGKQNSFASRAHASFVLAEKGDQQPRSLAVAFLKPIAGRDYLADAIKAITRQRENMATVYGACADAHCEMNVESGTGSLAELLDFVAA